MEAMKCLIALVFLTAAGCGGRPPIPKRGVVESDLGSWKFRRFQPVLDVEVWVEGNRAEAFTASYVAEDALKRGRVEDKDLVNVFVTRYTQPTGVLRETVKFARRLAQDGGYTVDEDKVGGVRAVTIHGNGESWVLWASRGYVIKVGGHNRENVPASVVESYGDRYPSMWRGGMLEGPLPEADPVPAKKGDEEEPYDPDNPKPDMEQYDRDKAEEVIERTNRKDDEGDGDGGGGGGKNKGKGKGK
jgi:hypothetical protein